MYSQMDWTVQIITLHQTVLESQCWLRFFKICLNKSQLLTNSEHLKTVENKIRGSLASVYDERCSKANKVHGEFWQFARFSFFGFMLDANKLNRGIMKTEHLPVGDLMSGKVSLEQVLNTPADSQVGYILELDLTYPHNILDLHCKFISQQRFGTRWVAEHLPKRFEIQGKSALVICPLVTTYRCGQKLIPTLILKFMSYLVW